MNKKNVEITSWIFPIVLLFIIPEVGTFFIIFKIFSLITKGVKKSNIEERKSRFNTPKPHDIDFSHDHSVNDNVYGSSSSNYKSKTFDSEINVRCPICNANNFIKEIPYECEYCGNHITKA